LTPPSSGALPSSIGTVNVSSLSVPNGSLPGTVTGAKPVGTGSSAAGGDVSTLDWWQDFATWWAQQTDNAKNVSLQDEEASQVLKNARATGDVNKVLAAEAYISNLAEVARLSGCNSIIKCNTPDMKNLRETWKNTQDLDPVEQIKLQTRIGLNVYRLGVEGGGKDSLSTILSSLAKNSKRTGNGERTADNVWGVGTSRDAHGFNLTSKQYSFLKGVQMSYHNGSGMTSAQWRNRIQGSSWDRMWRDLSSISDDAAAKFLALYGNYSDEDWKAVAEMIAQGALALVVAVMAAQISLTVVVIIWFSLSRAAQAALLGVLSSAGVGAFVGAFAQLAVNAILIACGAKDVGLFDDVGGQAVVGGAFGAAGGVANMGAKVTQSLSKVGGNLLQKTFQALTSPTGLAVGQNISQSYKPIGQACLK
jgi:hypothetical protein